MQERMIPRCRILGVEIAAVNMDTVLCFIKKNLRRLQGQYICVSNVHTTVMSYESKEYQRIQNEAALALPDGNPLSVICRRKGFSETERVTGPDLMKEIFACSHECGYTHYFYGSTPETLKRLEEKLRVEYGLSIAGMYSPPFREMTEKEDLEAVDRMNESKADFVWVALGAPKQEQWMYAHQGKVRGLMIGIGAGVDYFAGNIKRAPMWMQKCSLEWMYRFLQEPKRLFRRYLVTNTKFLWLIVRGR